MTRRRRPAGPEHARASGPHRLPNTTSGLDHPARARHPNSRQAITSESEAVTTRDAPPREPTPGRHHCPRPARAHRPRPPPQRQTADGGRGRRTTDDAELQASSSADTDPVSQLQADPQIGQYSPLWSLSDAEPRPTSGLKALSLTAKPLTAEDDPRPRRDPAAATPRTAEPPAGPPRRTTDAPEFRDNLYSRSFAHEHRANERGRGPIPPSGSSRSPRVRAQTHRRTDARPHGRTAEALITVHRGLRQERRRRAPGQTTEGPGSYACGIGECIRHSLGGNPAGPGVHPDTRPTAPADQSGEPVSLWTDRAVGVARATVDQPGPQRLRATGRRPRQRSRRELPATGAERC